MVKVILNRLKPQAEKIIGQRTGWGQSQEKHHRTNLQSLKYLQHQQNLYHIFLDFKRAFDLVWYAALWATMGNYNINANLVCIIDLYENAMSAVQMNGSTGEWFRTTVGVRQGYLFSPTFFNIFFEEYV